MSSKELIIEAGRTERQYWKDLRNYRELFYFLAWRDILVRYKQTVIGILWALIRPLLIMVVFTVVFGKLAKLPSEGVPYPILVFAAMLPWQFFANAFSESSNSLKGIIQNTKENIIEALELRSGKISPEIIDKINQTNDPAKLKEFLKKGVQVKEVDHFGFIC